MTCGVVIVFSGCYSKNVVSRLVIVCDVSLVAMVVVFVLVTMVTMAMIV